MGRIILIVSHPCGKHAEWLYMNDGRRLSRLRNRDVNQLDFFIDLKDAQEAGFSVL
jgi:hypothetical protein